METSINIYPKSTLRIALAQVTSKDGNISENINKAVKVIKNAAKEGAKVVVFPEKFLTGYVPELVETNIEKYTILKNDSRLEPIHNACRENKIYAIVGAPLRDNENVFVSSIIIDECGKEIGLYNKTHLFHTEKSLFKSDEKMYMLEIDDWKIGLGICYDSGFPEHARALAKAGCHMYLVSALFSKGNGYSESRIWFPARALDNTIYTAMCNYVGKTGIWDTCGSSGVWNPLGKLVKEASSDEEEILIVDLDPRFINVQGSII